MASTPIDGLTNMNLIVKIKLGGKDMGSYAIRSLKVHHAINRVSAAELVWAGEVDAGTGDIPVTDSDDFNPGKSVEILAGYEGTAPGSLFRGIIVKHNVSIDAGTNFLFLLNAGMRP